ALLGFCAFAYSTYQAATALFNLEWLVLTFITITLVSRLDIKLLQTPGGISLTDSFIFLTLILYGTPLAVVLAGLDAAVSLLQSKNRNKSAPLLVGAAILAVSIAGGVVSLAGSLLESYSTAWGYLAFILALLALTHFLVHSLLINAALAMRLRCRFVEVWK